MDNQIDFDRILQRLMEELGLNQQQLASLVGVRQSQVSNWKRGVSLPGYHSIKVLCKELRATADELLGLEQRRNYGKTTSKE